jgi:hypothetical protein
MNNTLKYQWLIDELEISETCPYNGCSERTMTAYRWTFSDINHPDNFLPVGVLDKKRYPPRINDKSNNFFKCSCSGLSMYHSLESATLNFMTFPKRTRELLGYTSIAEGNLQKNEGLIGDVNEKGHFDFFEYIDIDLSQKFKIVFTFE